MKNARKPEHILELEKPDRESETLSSATPELEKIAKENGLTLKNDWLEVVRIYDNQKLNR